ncbi:MAG: tetraacyldisaccharide 4'-kinase, partial [Vicinamibacterales bacterium]
CLIERGERPSILSRGYGRREPSKDVTIVSDGAAILAELSRSGDEPMLLAQLLPGVPVLVCPDRYEAGLVAERQFDVTVHLLDDGFQHLQLARDVDLLMVDERDLSDRVLPAGRLREPLSSAAAADAIIVVGGAASAARAADVAERLSVADAFFMPRRIGTPRTFTGEDLDPHAPVYAVAGIARPERFFADLSAAGWMLTGTRTFRDHHPFRPSDVAVMVSAARASGAEAVVTTEKDAVRLGLLDLSAIPVDLAATPIAVVPLVSTIEPAAAFGDWLMERVRRAREVE